MKLTLVKSCTLISFGALSAVCSVRVAPTRATAPAAQPHRSSTVDARAHVPASPSSGCPGGAVRVGGGDVFVTRHPLRYLSPDGGTQYFTGAPIRVPSFCLDSFEVSAAKLHSCVRSGRCRRERRWDLLGDPQFCSLDNPSVGVGEYRSGERCTDRQADHGDLPANCVRFESAREYCQSVGGDLPTEEQFQRAARASLHAALSRQSSAYNLLDPVARRRYGDQLPSDVQPASQDNEPFLWPAEQISPDVVNSIYNLRGNVSEWVRTSEAMQRVMDVGSYEDHRRAGTASTRGGSFLTCEIEEANGAVDSGPIGHCYASSSVGFRCAYPLLESSGTL